jgi:mannose-6-phosphate isomerase-like protein (cupin superfamily)
MGEFFDAASLEWQPVRPDVAREVYGKTLLAEDTKLVLTRVAPGGKFALHQDDYGHLFYFLSGEGLVWVQDEQFKAMPGLVVRVTAGEAHAYENISDQDLMLISVNIPTR